MVLVRRAELLMAHIAVIVGLLICAHNKQKNMIIPTFVRERHTTRHTNPLRRMNVLSLRSLSTDQAIISALRADTGRRSFALQKGVGQVVSGAETTGNKKRKHKQTTQHTVNKREKTNRQRRTCRCTCYK